MLRRGALSISSKRRFDAGRDPTVATPRHSATGIGRSVGLFGSQRVATLLLGAIRTKIAAAVLGPAGLGLLAQALGLQELLRQVSAVGTSRGFLRLVAEYAGNDERDKLGRLIVTATTLVTAASALVALACLVWADAIAAWVFDDPGHGLLVQVSALTIVVAVPGAMAARVFNGMLDLRSFLQATLVEAAISVAAMAALVVRGGLTGAVISFAVAETLGSLFAIVLVVRRVVRPLRLDLRPARPDRPMVTALLRYAGALTATSLAGAGAALVVRTEILRQAGADANGLYQVAWQVGQNYLGILGVSMWSYGMPRIASQLGDPEAIVALQNDFMRIAVLLLAPGIVLLLVTRELWVPLLYSRAFVAGGAILAWQLAGELVAMMRQTMNISLLPRERLQFLVAQGVGYWVGWAALSWLLLPRFGVLAVPFAYCVTNLALLLLSYDYHCRWLGYRLDAENRRLIAGTLPFFVAALVLTQRGEGLAAQAAPLAVIALWALVHGRFLVRLRELI